MDLVLVTLLMGIPAWLLVASKYRTISSKRPQIQVPFWLARICGAPSSNIDLGLFSMQLLILLFIFWTLLVPRGQGESNIWQPGCLVLFFIVSIATIILGLFTRRK